MIYFARAEDTDFVKIGFTAGSAQVRLQSLQTGCPHKLVLEATVHGDFAEEMNIHTKLVDARCSQGEWFQLTREQVRQFLQQNPQLRPAGTVLSFREFTLVGCNSMEDLWERLEELQRGHFIRKSDITFFLRVDHAFSNLMSQICDQPFEHLAAYVCSECSPTAAMGLVEAAQRYYHYLVVKNVGAELKQEALKNVRVAQDVVQKWLNKNHVTTSQVPCV